MRRGYNIKATSINEVKFIVLNKNTPFIPAKRFIGKGDIVVSWDNVQNCYTVQVIPIKDGSFETKYSLIPTNTQEEIFCHKAGFIGKYKTLLDKSSVVVNVDKVGLTEVPVL